MIINNQKKDKFYGKSAMEVLKKLGNTEQLKFKRKTDLFFDRCLLYLDKWYDFDTSEYMEMANLFS